MRVPGSRMWAVLPTTVLLRRACADVFAVLFELGYKKRKTQNGSKGVGQYCVLTANAMQWVHSTSNGSTILGN